MKKALITAILSAAILLSGCAGDKESSAIPENTIPSIDGTFEESGSEEAILNKPDNIFPPVGIIAPITTTSLSVKEFDPDEDVVGCTVDSFYLDNVEYIDSEWGSFGFVITDDGNVVIDENWVADITDPNYKNKVIEALHELFSLEYVGFSYLNEHLFRYGDDLLAIANNPEGMKHYPFFNNSGYDESQFYYAHIFEAYKPHGVFPPEGITAPTTPIRLSTHEYETGEEVPAGNHAECFELDGIMYVDSAECGSFDFVIEDDWNIVVEGEPEYEDNKVVQALRNLYRLEYVGLSHIDEHLFRFGNDILAIAKHPAAKIQSVYFKDYDYDESQFYYARIYEPYDFN